MTGDIKIWLTVKIHRDAQENLSFKYKWLGTDGLDYSPEFDNYKDAADYPKDHTLKPIKP